ncbi:serine/threonine-protein phosphatase, partial [Streptomyces sp. NPDC054838]
MAMWSVPLALIAVVTTVDVLAPPDVHLGPFLAAAPAVTASFAGPRATAFVGAVAVAAQVAVAIVRTTATDLNHTFQIVALILISVFVTFFAHLREVHEAQLTQLRSVAETAQQV